jgi:hypothetical protein
MSTSSEPDLRINDRVVDRWWPWRMGRIVKRTKTTAHVRWSDDMTTERYDRSHLQFLRPIRNHLQYLQHLRTSWKRR